MIRKGRREQGYCSYWTQSCYTSASPLHPPLPPPPPSPLISLLSLTLTQTFPPVPETSPSTLRGPTECALPAKKTPSAPLNPIRTNAHALSHDSYWSESTANLKGPRHPFYTWSVYRFFIWLLFSLWFFFLLNNVLCGSLETACKTDLDDVIVMSAGLGSVFYTGGVAAERRTH